MGNIDNKTLRVCSLIFDITFHIFMQNYIWKLYRVFLGKQQDLYKISGNFLTEKTRKTFKTLEVQGKSVSSLHLSSPNVFWMHAEF